MKLREVTDYMNTENKQKMKRLIKNPKLPKTCSSCFHRSDIFIEEGDHNYIIGDYCKEQQTITWWGHCCKNYTYEKNKN